MWYKTERGSFKNTLHGDMVGFLMASVSTEDYVFDSTGYIMPNTTPSITSIEMDDDLIDFIKSFGSTEKFLVYLGMLKRVKSPTGITISVVSVILSSVRKYIIITFPFEDWKSALKKNKFSDIDGKYYCKDIVATIDEAPARIILKFKKGDIIVFVHLYNDSSTTINLQVQGKMIWHVRTYYEHIDEIIRHVKSFLNNGKAKIVQSSYYNRKKGSIQRNIISIFMDRKEANSVTHTDDEEIKKYIPRSIKLN